MNLENDGSHRFTVITVQAKPYPICIISFYLPSTYTKKGQNHLELFIESLDELDSIIEKYKSLGFKVILGGDANDSQKMRYKVFQTTTSKKQLKVPLKLLLLLVTIKEMQLTLIISSSQLILVSKVTLSLWFCQVLMSLIITQYRY